MKTLKQTLEAKQLNSLRKMTTLSPWIEGSLVSTSRFCGKKNCACHQGGQALINPYPECLKKQRQMDALKEEIQRLRQKLSYRARQEKEGFFGSSTSSA